MTEDPQKPDSTEALSRLFGSIVKEGKTLADEVSGNAKALLVRHWEISTLSVAMSLMLKPQCCSAHACVSSSWSQR